MFLFVGCNYKNKTFLTFDGIRQGPEPRIGTGGYELGTDGISTDLSNKYR